MANEIRVLIVDDSAFARMAIARELKITGGIEVIDFARNGMDALAKIKQLKPDVVTLDVEMPEMDGLETLKRIMAECPTPVVMLSSLTGSGTEATLKALEIGAVDFFLKNTLANPIGNEGAADTLKNKIIMASKIKAVRQLPEVEPQPDPGRPVKKDLEFRPAELIVVIGSSTGGPKTLYQVVPNLPADIPAAVLIVQHMPPGFTYSLANRLNQLSNIRVKEAAPGDAIYQGMAYVARGGNHMVIDNNGKLELTQTATVCGVRPSVNVTMESVVEHYGSAVLGVVLTGMGTDGTVGAQRIKSAGGKILVQDESTCVVYGMPKSIVDSGYADAILPISRMTDSIVETLKTYPQGVGDERSRIHFVKK
jgi:two-component system, chemotaxis family, protein-glutamate methylesterase/glutaminase